MKEKANTMVRHRNKDRKKMAVRQWVSLLKPRVSLQLLLSFVVGGAAAVPPPSSPLFRGSPSVARPAVSIVASQHHHRTELGRRRASKAFNATPVRTGILPTLAFRLFFPSVPLQSHKVAHNNVPQNSLTFTVMPDEKQCNCSTVCIGLAGSTASTFVRLRPFTPGGCESTYFVAQNDMIRKRAMFYCSKKCV